MKAAYDKYVCVFLMFYNEYFNKIKYKIQIVNLKFEKKNVMT